MWACETPATGLHIFEKPSASSTNPAAGKRLDSRSLGILNLVSGTRRTRNRGRDPVTGPTPSQRPEQLLSSTPQPRFAHNLTHPWMPSGGVDLQWLLGSRAAATSHADTALLSLRHEMYSPRLGATAKSPAPAAAPSKARGNRLLEHPLPLTKWAKADDLGAHPQQGEVEFEIEKKN